MIKKPTDSAVKKNSAAVQKFLDELAKIGNIFIYIIFIYISVCVRKREMYVV